MVIVVSMRIVSHTRASAAAVLLVVVAGSIAWGIGSRVQSPEQAAARAAEPEASWITVPVDRRVLTSTVVVRGDVAPEVSVAAGVPSSVEGAGVVTGLGPAVGESVVEGSRLLLVSGRPVFALKGAVPVYRTLGPGMSGEDVAQLQAALMRMGYSPDSDGTFRTATMSAVHQLPEFDQSRWPREWVMRLLMGAAAVESVGFVLSAFYASRTLR